MDANPRQSGSVFIDSQHAELPFLKPAKEIALSHQEKWDGSGYPQGLAGEAIPLGARLMAVADVYDALISDRVYKAGMPHDQALDIMRAGRGSHFDPDILDAFLGIHLDFKAIADQFHDHPPTLDTLVANPTPT